MRIAIMRASGYSGAKITAEALARGHEATAIVRHTERLAPHARLTAAKGDATNAVTLRTLLIGHDVVISAFNPRRDDTALGTQSMIAMIDEVERSQHHRRRFTVAH